MTEFFGTSLIYFLSQPSLSNPPVLFPICSLSTNSTTEARASSIQESPSTHISRKLRSSPNLTACKHAQASTIAGVTIFLLG
ncbi:putative protein isoform X2 [Gossypium australe]|uniref:Uncharacterized protein n=1 Tax=Gossypium australe TaxID=47621 RepID=A0A5B6UHK4_9ROSI|nr:putative protein isoform X2 [Gossypium australe]